MRVSFFASLFLLSLTSTALAHPSYGNSIPNGRVGSQTRCWMCHNNVNGGGGCGSPPCLNPFGVDFGSTVPFQHTAYEWDRWLAAVDSDNDGWSNGQELRSNWGSNSSVSSQWTLPGNPSISCSAAPSGTTLRSQCFADLSSSAFSSFATSGRREPFESSLNPCSSSFTSDCASVASCSRSSTNGRGDWSCSCASGYSGTGHRRTANHDFATPNSSLGDDRLYSIRSSLVSGCVDINECFGNPCNNGTCSQTSPGVGIGYTCNCFSGYTFNGASCVVENTCTDNPSVCGVGTCEELSPPQRYNCDCPAGSSFNGTTCIVEDICVLTPTLCDTNAACAVSPFRPGYTCTCNAGYSGTGQPGNCADDDECRADANLCLAVNGTRPIAGSGRCTNTPGSYTCRCSTGFELVTDRSGNEGCADTNECLMRNICGVGGVGGSADSPGCVNTAGSYTCNCAEGYVFEGGTCVDVDECADEPCGRGTCSQEFPPPGYSCLCDEGYRFDGTTCVDIDECAEGIDNCSDAAECTNVVNPALGERGFTCTCNLGPTGLPAYTTDDDGVTCSNINECPSVAAGDGGQGTARCAEEGSECTDLEGSFSCACAPGYDGNGLTCIDIDECASNPCDESEICVNQLGGVPPLCECAEGFARIDDDAECVPACGDGNRTRTEECDDGNTAADDGCSTQCEIEDGYVCFEETVGGQSRCLETCGDGLIDAHEECDDGEGNDDTSPNTCRRTCLR
ncbi:MAG: DUF4215 domain-containing protein, partial [Myxococcota bacterium]